MDPTRDPHLGLPDDIDEKVHCRRFDAQEPMMFPTYYYFLTFLFHTIDACLINRLSSARRHISPKRSSAAWKLAVPHIVPSSWTFVLVYAPILPLSVIRAQKPFVDHARHLTKIRQAARRPLFSLSLPLVLLLVIPLSRVQLVVLRA